MDRNASDARTVYVGTGRRLANGWKGYFHLFEPERIWRERLAQESEHVCQEMYRRGLRLTAATPVLSTESFKGSWTEGMWLHFEADASR